MCRLNACLATLRKKPLNGFMPKSFNHGASASKLDTPCNLIVAGGYSYGHKKRASEDARLNIALRRVGKFCLPFNRYDCLERMLHAEGQRGRRCTEAGSGA